MVRRSLEPAISVRDQQLAAWLEMRVRAPKTITSPRGPARSRAARCLLQGTRIGAAQEGRINFGIGIQVQVEPSTRGKARRSPLNCPGQGLPRASGPAAW